MKIDAMTAGAVALAAFAVYYVARPKTAAAKTTTTGTGGKNDAAFQRWLDHFDTQAAEMSKGIDYSLGTLAPGIGLNF